MPKVMFYADTVKLMIKNSGMSVREFAISNHITPGTLGMWLRKERNPKLKNIRQLAAALNCQETDISDCKHQEPDNRRLRGYLVKINDEFATALIERYDQPGLFDEVELKRIG